MDTLEPQRRMPYVLIEEPARMKLRMEQLLPVCTKSRTDIALPMRAKPYILNALPRRAYERRLKDEP